MKYLSTRNNKLNEKFIDVVFNGLAKDGGLYLPKSWPVIDLKSLYNKSYEDVAFNIIDPFKRPCAVRVSIRSFKLF